MHNCIIIQCLVMCIIYTADANTYFEDYCWRDYEGIIPSDALKGGLDRNGKPIYIGQVLFQDKLIPGKIHENDNKIYFEWYDEIQSSNRNIKILCSQHPQKFEWIPTQYNQVVHLTNTILLKGGFEDNHFTYIGRALADGETSVGKVVCSTDDCFGLYTIVGGQLHTHQSFEILSFNPQIENYNRNPPIDVRAFIR